MPKRVSSSSARLTSVATELFLPGSAAGGWIFCSMFPAGGWVFVIVWLVIPAGMDGIVIALDCRAMFQPLHWPLKHQRSFNAEIGFHLSVCLFLWLETCLQLSSHVVCRFPAALAIWNRWLRLSQLSGRMGELKRWVFLNKTKQETIF